MRLGKKIRSHLVVWHVEKRLVYNVLQSVSRLKDVVPGRVVPARNHGQEPGMRKASETNAVKNKLIST
jgi:hypothetical protein